MERRPKTHTQPLPRSKEALIDLLKRALELSEVEEIRVTPSEFHIRRSVHEDEEVLPKTDTSKLEIDPDFLLKSLELEELPIETKDDHPYLRLQHACSRIGAKGLSAIALLAPDGEWLSAFLGLDESRPERVLGLRAVYTVSPSYEEKIVVIGASSNFLIDARVGVIIDLGV